MFVMIEQCFILAQSAQGNLMSANKTRYTSVCTYTWTDSVVRCVVETVLITIHVHTKSLFRFTTDEHVLIYMVYNLWDPSTVSRQA